MNIPILKDAELERFMSLIDTSTGCWFWDGPRDDAYQPVFKHNGGEYSARDILYQQKHGVTDLSPCKIGGCINPDHIQKCDDKKPRKPRSGLSGSDVLEILDSIESVADIAKKYEVSVDAIYSIIKGTTWKHIPRPRVRGKTVFRKRKLRAVVKTHRRDIKTPVNGVTFNPDTEKYTASYYKKVIGESASLEEAAEMRAEHIRRVHVLSSH